MSSAGCKSRVVELFFMGVCVEILVGGVNFFLHGGGLIFLDEWQFPHFIFRTKKCEIQTKYVTKSLENQTKSGPNLSFFRTGFTKTDQIPTLGQYYCFKVRFV